MFDLKSYPKTGVDALLQYSDLCVLMAITSTTDLTYSKKRIHKLYSTLSTNKIIFKAN